MDSRPWPFISATFEESASLDDSGLAPSSEWRLEGRLPPPLLPMCSSDGRLPSGGDEAIESVTESAPRAEEKGSAGAPLRGDEGGGCTSSACSSGSGGEAALPQAALVLRGELSPLGGRRHGRKGAREEERPLGERKQQRLRGRQYLTGAGSTSPRESVSEFTATATP